jgi:hypothetical protein
LSLQRFICNLAERINFIITGINMSGSWGCPHEVKGLCSKIKNLPCNPGMKGCVLFGRFTFSDPDKNSPAIKRKLADRQSKREQGNKQ